MQNVHIIYNNFPVRERSNTIKSLLITYLYKLSYLFLQFSYLTPCCGHSVIDHSHIGHCQWIQLRPIDIVAKVQRDTQHQGWNYYTK